MNNIFALIMFLHTRKDSNLDTDTHCDTEEEKLSDDLITKTIFFMKQ